MTLALWIHALGSIGIFTSRAFLPAFATALLLRYGPQVSWIADSGLLRYVQDVPTWFTSDPCLLALGVLSIAELMAERVPEVKAAFDEVHGYLKAAMAGMTFLGVLGATDRSAFHGILGEHAAVDILSALAVGGGTLLTGGVRRAVLEPFDDIDQDDDLGIRGLLRPVEDFWAFAGPIALILMPLLTVLAFLMTLGVLVLIERRLNLGGRVQPIACQACGRPMDPRALECPHCHATAASVAAIGPLGGILTRPANPARQPFALISVKRCPSCAARLTGPSIHQTCASCGRELPGDPAFVRAYVGFVDRRAFWVVPACTVLGLIPFLGIIPAVMLYRLAIVAPFRCHAAWPRPGDEVGLRLRWWS
ncbi:MAG: DUF4126 domain-containing protein [Isosphaeraceae bacterium]